MSIKSVSEDAWRDAIVAYLKVTMRAKGVDFPELARRLHAAGVDIDRATLANRINRRGFGAGFFMQLLAALDEQAGWLAEVAKHLPEHGVS